MSAPRPTVVGVDPGPTPGIAVLAPDGTPESLQVTTPDRALSVVRMLVAEAPAMSTPRDDDGWFNRYAVLAVERFVVGKRTARSKTPKAGETTRNLVGALEALAAELNIPIRLRSASEVKPWASNERLAAAGLYAKGLIHAQDAGRHALFCAVHDTGSPDPLSNRSRSPR